MKRLRLRGDWSDTGPRARPESERERDGKITAVSAATCHVCVVLLHLKHSVKPASPRDSVIRIYCYNQPTHLDFLPVFFIIEQSFKNNNFLYIASFKTKLQSALQ